MTREWKTGDVAIVERAGREVRATFYDTGGERGWWQGKGVTTEQFLGNERALRVIRPLVVIDPDDREQVERLLSDYHQWKWATEGSAASVNDMQAALRSLVAPPKPEEPKGLGAVVEDADGVRWVRADSDAYPWRGRVEDTPVGRRWSAITAVRVLSEGVA